VSDAGVSVRLRQNGPIALDVAFTAGPDDVLAIFGPSGSGKTTILRSIAGLYRPLEARVVVGGRVWTDTMAGVSVPTHRRQVGVVFQDYALFPHLTASQNVQIALSETPAANRAARASGLLERVHLSGEAAERRPAHLSGGERQRVALARALARDPRILLLDEPFAAVDRPTRRHLRSEVDGIRRTLNVPTILVTHDLDDVIRLATHLLVLDRGREVASGPLTSLLSRPDLQHLRDLVGLGSLVEAVVSTVDAERGLTTLAFDGGVLVAPHQGASPGDRVRVRIPAREVILSDRAPAGLSLHNAMPGIVSGLSALPASPSVVVQITVGGTPLLAEVTRDAIERLHIAVGLPLYALIKSVSLEF
jgi:molybdate transport system ATP-binding protein